MSTARTIKAKLSWDEEAKEWIATTTSGPTVVTRAALYEDVIVYLRRGLQAKLNTKDFTIEEEIELPQQAQDALREVEEATEQLAKWARAVPQLRMKFLKLMTGELNLLHHHAAHWLGVTPSYLSKIKDQVAMQMTAETTEAHTSTKTKARGKR